MASFKFALVMLSQNELQIWYDNIMNASCKWYSLRDDILQEVLRSIWQLQTFKKIWKPASNYWHLKSWFWMILNSEFFSCRLSLSCYKIAKIWLYCNVNNARAIIIDKLKYCSRIMFCFCAYFHPAGMIEMHCLFSVSIPQWPTIT